MKKNIFLTLCAALYSCSGMNIKFESPLLPEKPLNKNITQDFNTLCCMQVGKLKKNGTEIKNKNKDKKTLILNNYPIKFFLIEDSTENIQMFDLCGRKMEQSQTPYTVTLGLKKELSDDYVSLFMYNFITAKNFRNKGYGEALYIELLSKHFYENDIDVNFESAHKAIGFYEQRGAIKLNDEYEPKMV